MNEDLVNKLISFELQKPDEEVDVDFIDSCVDYLLRNQKSNPISICISKIKGYIKIKAVFK